MQPLHKRITQLQDDISSSMHSLDVDRLQQELAELDEQLAVPEVWNNPSQATHFTKKAADIRTLVDNWTTLQMQVADIAELMTLGDESMLDEFDQQITALEASYQTYNKDLLYDGEFDDHAAIMRISAGAGGTDAQDWAQMIERMYLRWAEKNSMSARSVDRSSGDEAGIKTSVIEIEGTFAYGKLKSEHGVHRLVRLSPFNSDNLRQTSFALVEVLPQIDTPEDASLDEKDLRIDVYRAGGHGGQSVNTTDSAVRVTHLPTNTVVAIQNERSQLQNKETALKILRSKLVQMKLEQHAEQLSDLQAGESASWGAQIRNYVLHPYTMVKDTRTKCETKDTKSVLDGDLNAFIEAYLLYSH